jgi:enoyl-CoA hydratase
MSDGDKPVLNLTVTAATATITLSRPKLNPIDDTILRRLDDALAVIEKNSDVTVVKICSDQSAFSAGADLAMVQSRLGRAEGTQDMMATARLFHHVYDRLAALPAVTIAYISGHALGGGLELALACDMRIASRRAKLGLPEARVGLLPGAGGTQRLTQLCGQGTAARLILACDLIDADEARDIGLVQWVFDDDKFVTEADRICAQIEGLSGPALRSAKACIKHAISSSGAGARAEVEAIGHLMKTEEARQRIDAFLSR